MQTLGVDINVINMFNNGRAERVTSDHQVV